MKPRTYYPTRLRVGTIRVVTFRRHRGFALIDETDGTLAWCTPHPISGRPTAAYLPDQRAALRVAASIDEARR